MRHYIKDDNVTPEELKQILEYAVETKKKPYENQIFKGPKSVAVLFDKNSTRTKFSFHAGISDLGGSPIIADTRDMQLGRDEPLEHTAKVLSGYCSMIVWRTYEQKNLETLAEHSTVPVINALSDDFHPCQLLADLLTIQEEFGELAERKLVYLGDGGNNMANSYLLAGANAGMHVVIATPKKYAPKPEILARARSIAANTNGEITITDDIEKAINNADVITTDTWTSMNTPESETKTRISDLYPYQINLDLVERTKPETIILHCLPAHLGEEITEEAFNHPKSRIIKQAHNRLPAQKGLMIWLDEQKDK